MFAPSALTRFGIGLVVSAVAVTCLFVILSPAYNALVVRASNGLIALLEEPQLTAVEVRNNHAVVIDSSASGGPPLVTYGSEEYFELILLLALLLATPKLGLVRRLAFVLIGLSVMVGLHTLALTTAARAHVHGDTWLRILFRDSQIVVALLVWGLLTFRYWLPWPRRQSVTLADHVGRNDPCPCGSGKKYKRCCIRTGDGG